MPEPPFFPDSLASRGVQAAQDAIVETEDVLLRAADKLMVAIGKGASILDPPTLATCALALEAIEGNGVFEVRS